MSGNPVYVVVDSPGAVFLDLMCAIYYLGILCKCWAARRKKPACTDQETVVLMKSDAVITWKHFPQWCPFVWMTGHYNDVIIDAIASQITNLTIVFSTVNSDTDQRKISKLRVTGLCAGNSPEAGEFPAQMASNAENVSIWWRHHEWFLTQRESNT